MLFTWRKIYIGSWKDGQGTYTYTDGRVNIGKYKNVKKNGKMKIKCPNGDTYQGDFKNGSPSGKFNFTDSKGEISEVDFMRLKNPNMRKK